MLLANDVKGDMGAVSFAQFTNNWDFPVPPDFAEQFNVMDNSLDCEGIDELACETWFGGGVSWPPPPCAELKRALVNFVNQNLPAAMTIANRLNTTVANILGLASLESGNGSGPIATNYNNYFSLEVGSAFPGRIGACQRV